MVLDLFYLNLVLASVGFNLFKSDYMYINKTLCNADKLCMDIFVYLRV